ncbi:MAG: PHB depolymerase family esterase [Labilithrix sp.]|nr:PHB depolymerase family esterase [Labilithrix sp.]
MRTLLLAAIALAGCGSAPTSSQTTRPCPPRASTADLPGAGGDLEEVASFGENPGALKMFVHVPARTSAGAVVVALHGCTQSARAYVAAGWNEVADRAGFVVVYPEQSSANNLNRCFNWFEPGDTAREAGEARSIASMTEHAKSTYGASRAFVTGLSAGAAMTAVMLATYPDLFEAGAIMAGIPYACASSMNDAFSCMSPGKDRDPTAWSALLPNATASSPPRVSIWHGAADWTVRPSNMTQLVRQWSAVNAVSEEPTTTTTEGRATHAEHRDASGVTRVESWSIEGMGHGVALAPRDGCGKAGAFMVDAGVCSTTRAATFFGLIDGADATATEPPPRGGAPAAGTGEVDCVP